MKPIVFEGRFGWLHPGEGARGVVLCSAFGHESVWSHGGMRSLADDLSARGMSVLRFDYRGTGDSVGADGSSDQFETAVADVCAAIAWLRQETGIVHVTLCGLRLGAAFALLAACQCHVDELVLLAPVVYGRSYVRELSIIRNIWLDQLPVPLRATLPQSGPFNVLGQIYSDAFYAQLNSFDAVNTLKNSKRVPASGTLIFDINSTASEPLRKNLEALGVEIEFQPFDGYAAFMQETAFVTNPKDVFAATVNWIAARKIESKPPLRAALQTEWDSSLILQTSEAWEQPVRFGAAGLFGILCKPQVISDNGSVLLITNTSASAHVGDSRLSVRIAREMARLGIASLRIDARGIGDSSSLPGARSGETQPRPVYSNTVVEDVAIAAAWLKEQGYRNVVSFGVCSGAYSALRAALLARALSGVVSVNLQSFHIPEGITIEMLHRQQSNSIAGYRSSLFELSKWKQVFRGERKIMPFIRLILSRATAFLRVCIADLVHLITEPSSTEVMPIDPHDVMRTLQRKGVKTLFVCGAYDRSLDLLTMHFGRRGKRLTRFSSAHAVVLEDLDHGLFNPHAAEKVVALCAEFVKNLDSLPTAVHPAAGKIINDRHASRTG